MNTSTQVPTQQRTALSVSGMTCGSCARTIERALAQVPGGRTRRRRLWTQARVCGGVRSDGDAGSCRRGRRVWCEACR